MLLLLGSVCAESGPYAWVAIIQLKMFGSYGESSTFVFAMVLWVILCALAMAAFKRLRGDPGPTPPPQGPTPTAQPDGASWILPGVFAVGLALILVGTLCWARPPAPRTLSSLREASQVARLWPTEVTASLQDVRECLDENHQVALRRNKDVTLFSPILVKGTTAVEAVCSGTPEAWKKLGDEGSGVLTLEPLPLIVRRAYTEAGLEAPLFRPVLRWDSGIGTVAMPWIIAGIVICGISGYLWHGSLK